MNMRTITFEELTSDEIAAWSAIQCDHAEFASPFFRPEFTQLVASARADVEIAVLEEDGAPVGFFPFQRSLFNAGQPVGSGISECDAVIASPEVACDPLELLRACGLNSWRFDHLVPVQKSFDQFAWSSAESPYIDLSEGFESYIASRPNGRRIMSEYGQLKRKFEREVGPIRFEPNSSDPAVLETCLRWKSAQARRTGRPDIFKFSWIPNLVNSVLSCQDECFGSAMPVCYVGDEIAAINFGVRSGGVFHPWFPTYNVDFANYSPGNLLWIETMQAAETQGIRRILLGKGEETYKKRFMSGTDLVAQGCVDARPAVATARRAWRTTRSSIKASPLRGPAQVPARIVNRISTWLMFR
jgi:CelD/BcsL family acetyltransferase involved in cellulose biosynthesis